MKNRIKNIILIISLAFNIGFVFMFFYNIYLRPAPIMHHHPPKNHRINRIMDSREMMKLKKENIESRIEFFNELAKPDYNQDTLEELILKLSESQKCMEDKIIQNFIRLRSDMSDEEAQNFFGRFEERYNARRDKYRNNERENKQHSKQRRTQ